MVRQNNQTKYIIVTGGVMSGLGKGVVSASIGRLFSPKYCVIPVKCDGYLNVDPGTMNPVEHGEVFVLDDGGEVDLDFGHYERFMNVKCKSDWSLTSGKIFQTLTMKERRGDFLGKTIQVIPHVTGEICDRLTKIARKEKADIVIVEIGGTVGDLENLWFLEAIRELRASLPPQDTCLVHLGHLPVADEQGQQKTKPLQQSITFLRERGLMPDVIVGRTKEMLTPKTKQKLSWLTGVPISHVISDPDRPSIYELPLIFEAEGLRKVISQHIGLPCANQLASWKKLVHNMQHPKRKVKIAVCGKYTELADSYISVDEALNHAGAHLQCEVQRIWIETTDIERGKVDVARALEGIDGVVVPGGFGARGTEGKIKVIEYARTHKIPYLGLCYGMQLAVVEYARNVCGLERANSTEVDPKTPYPVVDILPEQIGIEEKGGTMRLGGQDVVIAKHTRAHELFGSRTRRRFRHRSEVNPDFIDRLKGNGLVFSGWARGKNIMQVMELKDHPFFMASQFHPELTSTLEHPSPMFMEFVRAAMVTRQARERERPALPKPVKTRTATAA